MEAAAKAPSASECDGIPEPPPRTCVADGGTSQEEAATNTAKTKRKKKHAVKKMVAVVIVFAVCWAPFHLVVMLSDYGKLQLDAEKETILFASVQLLGFSNSTCNPIIYMALKKNVKSFCRTLRCQRMRRRRIILAERVEQNASQFRADALPLEPRPAWASKSGRLDHFSQVHLLEAPKQPKSILALTVMDPINP